MTSIFRKSAAVLLAMAVLLTAFALSGCFKIQKIDAPPADPILDPPPPENTPADGIEVLGKPTGVAEPAPEPIPVSIDYELLESALAIGLTGNGKDYLHDENGLWHVVGLYAALVGRVTESTPWLSDAACDALAHTLLPDEDPPGIPDAWFSDGGLVREDRNGVPGVSFPSYEEFLGSMLGVWRELRRPDDPDAPYAVEVVDHLEDGEAHTFVYIAFAEDPEDGQTKLVYLEIGDTLREGGSLDFTLGDVLEGNRLSNLLKAYDCVTLNASDLYGTDAECVWLRNGERVYYEVVEITMDDDDGGEPLIFHSENGIYRGLGFNTYLMAEPMISVWVTADPQEEEDYTETLITKYLFDDPSAEAVFVTEDDETVTFSLEETTEDSDGAPMTVRGIFTVRKDTLALTSCVWEYEGGMTTAFTVSYNGDKLGEGVMAGWDATRTVTVDIRTEAGARTETVTVPASWLVQLLVDEGITVYFDEACTDLTYNLLDAGGDTTLWARDEANTPAAKIDISSVTLENVIAANYLTALTERYKSVKIRTDTEYTDTDAWFFPDGGSVVQLIQHAFKASGTSSDLSGSTGDLDFFVEDDGSVFARGVVRAAPAVTPDPEYDAINTYLIDRLRGGTLDELAETDAGYTFRVSVPSYADNSPYIYRCTADKDTLALTEIREEGPEAALLCTVEYGGELPALADTYTAAMRKVRTVTYHASRDGKTYDTVFRVPADWSFYADTGDNALYADADLTAYSDGLVPSDGKNYAFWMTDGMSAAGSDGLPFTLKQVTDANYITALVKQYGQVAVHASYGYGTSEYAFFPYGDSVASYSEEEFEFDAGPTRSRTGIYGDLCFEVDEAGKTLATSYVIPGASDDEDYIAYETDAEGAFFSDNTRLNSVFWNSAIKDLTQDGDTYTFLSESSSEEGAEYEYAETYTVTVDKGTLAIQRILLTGDAYAAEVEYGKDIVPFAKTFSDAFADTRKLTYHVQMNGEKSDYAFEVPKTWDFTLGIVGDNLRFFRDKGLTDPTENLIPADQWNHEIWVSDARG